MPTPRCRFLSMIGSIGLGFLATSNQLGAQGGPPFPEGYPEPSTMGPALTRLAETHPRSVRVRSLGRSLQGRDLWLAQVGHPIAEGNPPRPTVLVVADLEADHFVGGLIALELIGRLAVADGHDPEVTALLDRVTLDFIPRPNPDGSESAWKAPHPPSRGNLRPLDRDRDGRSAEDGPNDLDGDGLITTMRVFDGQATQLANESDPRIAHRADASKGERARFREFTEGLDDDGDNLVNEDPPRGVDLDRNWPHRWAEFDPEAGTAPASEPEVLALIRHAFDHPEIAIVWNLGLRDNLAKAATEVEDADKPIFAECSRLAKATRETVKPPAVVALPVERPSLVSRPAAAGPRVDRRPAANEGTEGQPPTSDPSADGSLVAWAYHQFGVLGLASRVWPSPEFPPTAAGQPEPPAGGEARWLSWNDRVVGGRAFVPFAPFDHPTLGRVELGGWKPGVRVNPPISRLDSLVDESLALLKALAGRLPALAIAEARAEAKGQGVFEVHVEIENTGTLPTALAQGVRTRTAPPVRVRLLPGTARILAGKAAQQVDALAGSGGRRSFRWLVLAPAGVESLTVEADCAKAGHVSQVIPLR